MREVILARFDNCDSRFMNRIEAEAFGDDYLGVKLACAAQIDDTQLIRDIRYVFIELVKVSRVELRPERPAAQGSVIAFCEVYRTEQRRL